MGLLNDLGKGPIALDSAIFIYFIEKHPLYHPLVRPVFSAIDQGQLQAVTSSLTLLETLVQPIRRSNRDMMSNYEHILKDSKGVDLIPIDLKLLRVAAQVRAMAQVKTPDALQIASGLVQGCSAFLTNDKGMPSLSSIRILKLYDYLDPVPGC